MNTPKLKSFWQENIKRNVKKISAIMGDVLITVITVTLFAIKSELDWICTLMMILFAIKPFAVMYINIVFKGEAEAEKMVNGQLRQTIAYDRELAEYRVLLAAKDGKVPEAVIANKNWNDSNKELN